MLNLSRLRLHPHTPEDHRRPLNRLSTNPSSSCCPPPSITQTLTQSRSRRAQHHLPFLSVCTDCSALLG
ncbi:hypothetical protein SRHO_G00022670 [Serrasalmus rhombeus]